jgi:hypothetical protein
MVKEGILDDTKSYKEEDFDKKIKKEIIFAFRESIVNKNNYILKEKLDIASKLFLIAHYFGHILCEPRNEDFYLRLSNCLSKNKSFFGVENGTNFSCMKDQIKYYYADFFNADFSLTLNSISFLNILNLKEEEDRISFHDIGDLLDLINLIREKNVIIDEVNYEDYINYDPRQYEMTKNQIISLAMMKKFQKKENNLLEEDKEIISNKRIEFSELLKRNKTEILSVNEENRLKELKSFFMQEGAKGSKKINHESLKYIFEEKRKKISTLMNELNL